MIVRYVHPSVIGLGVPFREATPLYLNGRKWNARCDGNGYCWCVL